MLTDAIKALEAILSVYGDLPVASVVEDDEAVEIDYLRVFGVVEMPDDNDGIKTICGFMPGEDDGRVTLQ